MNNLTVQAQREQIAMRVGLVESDLTQVKSSVNSLAGKIDDLTSAIYKMTASTPASMSSILQTGAWAVVIVGALTTGITYMASNASTEKFHTLQNQLTILEHKIEKSKLIEELRELKRK
jgi:outer membrane murein-binding lipoprotein Lpp